MLKLNNLALTEEDARVLFLVKSALYKINPNVRVGIKGCRWLIERHNVKDKDKYRSNDLQLTFIKRYEHQDLDLESIREKLFLAL